MAWDVQCERGDAGVLHGRELGADDVVSAVVRVLEVERPALVLGSTQSDGDVDHDAARSAGIEVVRRHSGGGAVLLDAAVSWVDVDLPRSDRRWTDDVSSAALWGGRAWVDALTAVGVVGAQVHVGAMVSPPLAKVVCFAGLAPGEVTVDGAKVVGISQRRTRAGARFQCSVPFAWDAVLHARLLAPGIERVGGSIDDVRVLTVDGAVRSRLVDAFIAALD